MGRIKEIEMFEPLRAWLTAYGYEVYVEVSNGGYRADIVCKLDNIFTVIEMKTSMNLEVIEQAFNWGYKAHYVYVAVPMKSELTMFVRNLLKSAVIGIILLDIDNINGSTHCSRICIAAAARIYRNIAYDWDKILIPEFMDNIGGSNDKKRLYQNIQ